VTHPWAANPGWYNNIAVLPYIGPLFLRTCVYPLGLLLIKSASRSVFEPQAVPEDYVRRAAIQLVLRPKTFYCNARDLSLLRGFIIAQVPRYVELRTPTVIITGDRDTTVSPTINARALARTLPHVRLVMLKDIGHMPHHAAPQVVAAAIDEFVPTVA
jgi:pimeloyl-ACP methyl ester carboxylesterase